MLFSNFYLPIEIIKTTNYEYENISVMYTEEELINLGTKKLEEELNSELVNNPEIINKQVNTYANKDYIEVEVIYEVLENIGIEDKIVF